MTGKIEQIIDTKSPQFKSVVIDGTKYGVRTELIDGFNIGDTVTFRYIPKGKFLNIDTIEKTFNIETEQSVLQPSKLLPKQEEAETFLDAVTLQLEDIIKQIREHRRG